VPLTIAAAIAVQRAGRKMRAGESELGLLLQSGVSWK